MTNSVYWIWLQLMFGIGTRRAELLMDYFTHPQQIYEGILRKDAVIGMLKSTELASNETCMEQAVDIERRTMKKGCGMLTPDHTDYPAMLRNLYNRPAVLYCKGDLTCLQSSLAVAMVGARKFSEYGKRAAAYLAGGLAKQNTVIVSGLAVGIDTQCHYAALEAGGKTIGVLGCGIDIDYPKPNRALKTAVRQSGAVITEYPLGTPPYPDHFPLRNRIICGISHATVVIEAGKNSGSLITAQLAREQGKDLFAVPGSMFTPEAEGVNQLIKEGARLVDHVEDILSMYPQYHIPLPYHSQHQPHVQNQPPVFPNPGIEAPLVQPAQISVVPPAPPKPPIPDGLSETSIAVYRLFDGEKRIVEDIIHAADLPVGEVLSALTELEIYGLIQSYPGRRFGLIL